MMNISYVFFCPILFFSFYANNPFAYGASATNCPDTKGVIRRHGPCLSSPASATPNTTQMLLQDERRVEAVNSHKRGGVGSKVDSFISNFVGSANFLVTVGFGTPIQYFKLILDTGSYITWVKCQPCLVKETPGCTKQNKDNSKSKYYPSFSDTSTSIVYARRLEYDTEYYFDRSSADGFFVHDKLTIPPADDDDTVITAPSPSDVYSNFSFLSAQETRGDFSGADGILGLGKAGNKYGGYSFISQTKTKGFCHCIPSRGDKGYLYFGKEAVEKCRNSATHYTPLLSNKGDPSFYYVNLIAITIGQKKVNIASSSSSASSSSPSTIIDSGTMISRLPRSVYLALESEFKELMSGFPLADQDKTLKTCYNLTGHDDNITIPNMALHFENNLDVNLNPITEVTLKVSPNDMSQVCFAFAAQSREYDLTIIGNHQLQKRNVLYNIQDQRVEIGPGSC